MAAHPKYDLIQMQSLSLDEKSEWRHTDTVLRQEKNFKQVMTQYGYTVAVDNGSYTNFVRDSAGYGLAQRTYYSRKQALFDYARSPGASIDSLDVQLAFLWQELQSYKTVISVLKAVTSVWTASDAVLTRYEKPADQSRAVK